MSRKRKFRTPQEKLAILKQHLVGQKPISDVCEAAGIAPSQFYRWQQELFDHGAACFDQGKKRTERSAEKQRIERLEKQLAQRDKKLTEKNEVIAELLEDHTKLKKTFGES